MGCSSYEPPFCGVEQSTQQDTTEKRRESEKTFHLDAQLCETELRDAVPLGKSKPRYDREKFAGDATAQQEEATATAVYM